MKYKWINRQNNKELIVFFNGWGLDETTIAHLNCETFDVLMFLDYQSFDMDFSGFEFEKYEKKYLICWSMGVYVVNLFKETFEPFDKKIAINGTPKMIDDKFGIPRRIFEITIKLFNESSGEKFIRNMFNLTDIKKDIKLNKTAKELQNELKCLIKINPKEIITFDMAYISTEDNIITAKNQLNYWLNNTNTTLLDAPHYPFYLFKSWKELL